MDPDDCLAALEGVRKRYGKITALDGIDLQVGRGELLAVLGPNGAGKTTAIAALLGLLRPDAGRARLFGKEPQDLDARRRVGVIMSTAAVPLGNLALTAGEFLRFAAVCVLGSVAFCAGGLCIGARVSARAAPAVVNLIYLPMLHLGGLFYPLPAFLAAAAPIWPVYHLHQLALAALGAPHRGQSAVHVAILAAEASVFGLLAIRGRDHD